VPFMVLVGDRDMENGSVSFRFRDGEQENGVPLDEAVRRITDAIEQRVQV
jgi:threonyl-tRNA synthetase